MDRVYRGKQGGEIFHAVERDGELRRASGDLFAGLSIGAPVRGGLTSVTLLSPVTPSKIVCVGRNYREHAKETGRDPPTVQMWFNKQTTCLYDPFAPVLMPAVSTALDYEVELVVVIAKRGRHVPKERAHEIIGGYMTGCDYSVRDWQRASQTMIMGKGFDTHGPG